MNPRSLFPSAAGKNAAAPTEPGGKAATLSTEPGGSMGRACCCPAKPAVRIIMPPSPSRPHSTELLLCGHHYRVSRHAPALARAAVYPLRDMPSDIASWVGIERDDSPDLVS
jgi:hypothetical protein